MSFSYICSLDKWDCRVQKKGMKCRSALSSRPKSNQPLSMSGRFSSSLFFEQMSENKKAFPGVTLHSNFFSCKEYILSIA
jgi:hypothetical protein